MNPLASKDIEDAWVSYMNNPHLSSGVLWSWRLFELFLTSICIIFPCELDATYPARMIPRSFMGMIVR